MSKRGYIYIFSDVLSSFFLILLPLALRPRVRSPGPSGCKRSLYMDHINTEMRTLCKNTQKTEQTHACTEIKRARAHTHTHMRTRTNTHTRTRTHTHTHTHTHTRTQSHTRTCDTCLHTRTYTRTFRTSCAVDAPVNTFFFSSFDLVSFDFFFFSGAFTSSFGLGEIDVWKTRWKKKKEAWCCVLLSSIFCVKFLNDFYGFLLQFIDRRIVCEAILQTSKRIGMQMDDESTNQLSQSPQIGSQVFRSSPGPP